MKVPLFAFVLLCAIGLARADVPLPANVLEPPTAPEAWNVIRLATANIERLVKENRLAEIIQQVSLCSPAVRRLAADPSAPERSLKLKPASQRAITAIESVATASGAGDRAATEKAFGSLREALREMGAEFDPEVVGTEIFFCPMHALFVSPKAETPCDKCGMALLKRRIPYSFIYVPPGEPSMLLSADAGGPIEAGKTAKVRVQLKQRDGKPVRVDDLMVMHTEPIHLLIIEPSLSDYHHEHPAPTDTPGEYSFTFTPKKSSAYRIFADVVPIETGVQEYPVTDLPGTGAAEEIGNMDGRFLTTVDGFDFRLSFEGGALPRVRQVRNMQIEVRDAAGKPVRRLEPLMNAFAHLVGFYDDHRTVVHLHPEGGDVTRPDLRGGPVMGFKFYPPRAGFMRLFCQVIIDGKMFFAPFNVNVAP
jgi:hypothetical protein